MIKIGLTGGIGSGKTTVASVFEKLGIPVYYSDTKAKELMRTDALKSQISKAFGENIYSEDGSLNRVAMAEVVFRDSAKLAVLNSIVHPAVEQDFLNWASMQITPYVIQEAAILVESGAYRHMDEIIVVKAPLEVRIERVIKRDHMPREVVERRIASQINQDELLKYASDIILSDGKELLLPQIIKIDSRLRKKTYICTL